MTGFWRECRQAFFDVKVVSPFARSCSHMSQSSLFRMAEKSKLREHKERIRDVEHGDFNPLVFTTVGGMAPRSQVVVKKLAETLSVKQGLSRSVVTGWLSAIEFCLAAVIFDVCAWNSPTEVVLFRYECGFGCYTSSYCVLICLTVFYFELWFCAIYLIDVT